MPWRLDCCVLSILLTSLATGPSTALAVPAARGHLPETPQPPADTRARFHLEAPPADAAALRSRFEAWQLQRLEMLNRADVRHLDDLDSVVAPDGGNAALWSHTPLPHEYPWAARDAKLLVVHQPRQVFGAYEWGQLVRWGPVSTGRRTMQTPAGLFHLTWRSPGRHSTVDPDWFMPWYFNFENDRGLSLHQYALPGRPASHACIRMLERDARWLFDWGETWTLDERGWTVLDPGTPLLIVGCYDFEAPPPWRDIGSLADGIELPVTPALDRVECDERMPSGAFTTSALAAMAPN